MQLYIKQKPLFPCVLTSNEKGVFESNLNCLKKIPLDKVVYRKEDDFTKLEIRSSEKNRSIQNIMISNDIRCVYNEANFKGELKNILGEEIDTIYHVGNYKLYSFSINEEDLAFNDKYINELNEISKTKISDKEKASKIEDIFKRTGFFIPLKIYIGGIFSYQNETKLNNTDKEEKEKYSLNVQKGLLGNENDFSNSYLKKNKAKNSSKKIKIIGGDIFKEDLEEWKKTVKLDNANIIEYSNLISSKDIIPLELKKELEKPLQLVEEKYAIRKKYFDRIHSLKEKKYNLINKQNYGNFEEGELEECKNRYEPEIYVEKFKFFGDKSFFYWTTEYFEKSFKDLIVGFKIIGTRKDNYYNGQWTIMNNPILSHDIKIQFVSQFYRVEKFLIEVYLMKTPN